MSNAGRGRAARIDLVDTKPLLAAMEALLRQIGRINMQLPIKSPARAGLRTMSDQMKEVATIITGDPDHFQLETRPDAADERTTLEPSLPTVEPLAALYIVSLASLVSAQVFAPNPFNELLRSNGDLSDRPGTEAALRKCAVIGRELTNLDRLLGMPRAGAVTGLYALPRPVDRAMAIRQGGMVAAAERRRLGLGVAPLADIAGLLESQGVCTAVFTLPDNVSGLSIADPEAGAIVAVNEAEVQQRQAFSFAHEYAHVLLDLRTNPTGVTREDAKDTMLEIRANPFAGDFLLPPDGVAAILPTGPDRVGEAARPITLLEITHLANHFNVSRSAAIHQLRHLGLISEEERVELRRQDRRKPAGTDVREPGLPRDQRDAGRRAFRARVLELAFAAFEKEEITRGKLRELLRLVMSDRDEVEALVDARTPVVWLEYHPRAAG